MDRTRSVRRAVAQVDLSGRDLGAIGDDLDAAVHGLPQRPAVDRIDMVGGAYLSYVATLHTEAQNSALPLSTHALTTVSAQLQALPTAVPH